MVNKKEIQFVSELTIDDANCIDVLCYGHFNVIHPGHLRYLRFAFDKGKCLSVLIKSVGGSNDKSRHEFFPENDRREAVADIEMVSFSLLQGGLSIEACVNVIRPKYLVLGNELEGRAPDDVKALINAVRAIDGEVVFHSGVKHSYLNTINEPFLNAVERKQEIFQKAMERRGIKKSRLTEIVNGFSRTKIVVLGDLIIDEFKSVEPLGVSSEAPVMVVKELGQKRFVGGAGIVAAHISSLGGHSCLLSVRGDDEVGEFAERTLEDKLIDVCLVVDPNRPTTFKTRFVAGSQKIFRVSKLEDRDVTAEIEDKLFNALSAKIKSARGLIISDFVYGVVTDDLLRRVVDLAREENVLLFGDVQCSTQFGDVLKFKGFDLVLPNEREARFALGNKDDGLEHLAQLLISKMKCKSVGLTLDSQGMIIYNAKTPSKIDSEHFPALAVSPVDVAGAGDSMLATMAIAIASGADCFEASALGSLVANCAVSKVGNIPVERAELTRAIEVYM